MHDIHIDEVCLLPLLQPRSLSRIVGSTKVEMTPPSRYSGLNYVLTLPVSCLASISRTYGRLLSDPRDPRQIFESNHSPSDSFHLLPRDQWP